MINSDLAFSVLLATAIATPSRKNAANSSRTAKGGTAANRSASCSVRPKSCCTWGKVNCWKDMTSPWIDSTAVYLARPASQAAASTGWKRKRRRRGIFAAPPALGRVNYPSLSGLAFFRPFQSRGCIRLVRHQLQRFLVLLDRVGELLGGGELLAAVHVLGEVLAGRCFGVVGNQPQRFF